MTITVSCSAALASRRFVFGLACLASALTVTPARAAGDLLVAPTRVILDTARGTEVVLNNIGTEAATYRVSLELRRMTPEGSLVDVDPETATPQEKAALAMIRYSPRRIVLQPNQPQVIRVAPTIPAGTLPGEYRAHMLFRAVPEAQERVAPPTGEKRGGVNVQLRPIYGITIPIIVRTGPLQASAEIGKTWIGKAADGHTTFNIELKRSGNRSVYGEIEVTPKGAKQPLLAQRGLAVYAEIPGRVVSIPVTPEQASALRGPLTVTYREDRLVGGALIAEATRTAP